ncbi:MAG: hypothetical protein KDA51_20755 [Planctomycetales bacterium]|nr:hypothetical protein [Planctomycetales bacterium]
MTLISLAAGPLTMVFDCDTAFLRYVKLGKSELVRAVFAAVRDQNWDTIPFVFENLEIDRADDSFSIRFVANSLDSHVKFQWLGTLHGSASGEVSYHFRGTATEPFLRNRIGLCVLHPGAACAGVPCEVEHADGSTSIAKFPKSISPHQPFRNIRAITHPICDQTSARVTMAGDVFEMEDQRNWTDDSFKTYSTPLDIPFPVEVQAGIAIEQSVRIEIIGAPAKTASVRNANSVLSQSTNDRVCQIEIVWNDPSERPAIGFGCPNEFQFNQTMFEEMRRLKPDHLRVDIRFENPDWQQRLAGALELAGGCDASLELALFATASDSSQVQQLVSMIRAGGGVVARLLLFHPAERVTPSDLLAVGERIRAELGQSFPNVVGTDAYFAELNRGRPRLSEDRVVCYSFNPQVHAFDNLSLCETLQAQRETIDSAGAAFSADVVISPITLRPRFNPNATTVIPPAVALQSAIDPRQSSGFAAAWTLGTLASMACHDRLRSLTFYEAYGQRGIMRESGQRFGMTELFEWVLDSELFFRATSDLSQQIVALASQKCDGRRSVHVGNLSDQDCRVQFLCSEGNEQNVSVAAESITAVTIHEGKHA